MRDVRDRAISKPIFHAKSSVNRYGGCVEDYFEIHQFLDHTKGSFASWQHRAILHNTVGCFIVERVFGPSIKNSDGRTVSTRQVAEDHIKEDLGFVPSLQDWLKDLKAEEPWMVGLQAEKLSRKHHE